MAFDGKLLSGVTVLIAVVEAGTIARAAEALGLSPSGVSRALSRLEQRVGARLLARTTRSLSLTDEGRLVELFPEWSDERFPLYAVYPSRLHRAAKVRAFIEFCLEIMGGNQNAVPRKAR
jgi:DNA-binding transcriptional LysR family regulator